MNIYRIFYGHAGRRYSFTLQAETLADATRMAHGLHGDNVTLIERI